MERLRCGVRRQPTSVNDGGVTDAQSAVRTGLGRDFLEMREVLPMRGLLSDEDRAKVLRQPD
jgi:hypothetical protein